MIKKCKLLILFLPLAVFAAAAWGITPHAEYAGMGIKDCNACHETNKVPQNHVYMWAEDHRLYAEKRPNNCKDCHELSFCMDCHFGGGLDPDLHASHTGPDYMPRSHRSDWRELHAIKAFDDPRSCTRCHDQTRFCNACHRKFNMRALVPPGHGTDMSAHPGEARRNLLSCQACHPSGDVCLPCHSSKAGAGVNPHPKDWGKVKGNFKDASDKTCRVCHSEPLP